MAKNERLWIDMCAGSELKDTQGETLSVDGANIDELIQGRGRFNDNHGKGFFNSLGRVTEAKKIYKVEDCENERQKYYWEKIKAPYVYCKGYLYNDEDHPNARAAAAILRNIHRDDTPLRLKASVEGGVLARGIKDPTRLARTKIHSVALTFTPANNATLVEPLEVNKSEIDWESDKQLIKSVQHLAETNIPSFRHITRHASANTIYENINKITELAKSIGVDIEVKDFNPEQIMEKAILNKVATNVSKINSMIKALAPAKPVGGSSVRSAADEARTGKSAARDQYQQNIGKLKSSPVTPAKPKDTISGPNMKTQSASKVKHTNTLKTHASKAMRDPKYLDSVQSQLTQSGIHPDKVGKIIGSIKSHMQEGVKKSSLDKDAFKSKLKKALTAGYGGAGSPMDLTGGGVIQAESLDDGRSKSKTTKNDGEFQYITCDDCGNEQVYMQHQVKCRKCRKNFNMDKLKDFFE